MKKFSNPFSSSSPRFKGQGRVLGSSSSSSSNANSIPNSKPTSAPTNPKPLPHKTINSDRDRVERASKSDLDRKPVNGLTLLILSSPLPRDLKMGIHSTFLNAPFVENRLDLKKRFLNMLILV
ncbi:hypothetical protein RIF29_00874 [Crotalaria pallida]|uniref:Uncharacterized protein n=1 Tax=Crotalaria pallida TaxID=3830 RepID=A0AAN9IXA7_CROPI